MGAISANKPALMVTAGPRPVPCYRGTDFTIDDLWPVCERRRLGDVSDAEWLELEGNVNTGVGVCNVMGTAITMAAVAELLGFALPGSALAPAGSAARDDIARRTGEEIVRAVRAARRPQELITSASLENAFRVVCALGGSTNAVIHLEAIAGRNGLSIGTRNYEAWSSTTPYITNVRPGGHMLLRDLEEAGGIPAVVQRIASLLDTTAMAADGRPWSDIIASREFAEHAAIASIDAPLSPRGALTMLHGNLAPRGAVLKTAGTHEPRLQRHRGRAIVFEGVADLNARIDDPELDVTPDSVLVLRGMGAIGAPGMPEVGHIPIPAKLARAGTRDLLRLSDARMSGTSTGTVVLHITPEAAAGGPLGVLRTGDDVELDVDAGTIRHFLSPEQLAERQPYAMADAPTRGYSWLHRQHVLQADAGCDFDFLRADFRGGRG
jgi:dihydroxy-acid dehydratase